MSLKSLSSISIECMLSSVDRHLQADGCIYEMSSAGRRVRNPGFLKSGDLVQVRLWLPKEEKDVFIHLAEVRWVKNEWVSIDCLTMSPTQKDRIRQYSERELARPVPIHHNEIVVRA